MLPLHIRIPSLLPSLLILSSSQSNNFLTWAIPNAIPKAAPVAEALPSPTAIPEPESNALAQRQTIYNNAPFSGAIYLVGSNGAQLTSASAALCPNQAPQGCGNINVWNWCCPSGNTCAWANSDHSVVGCCPAGSTCSGVIDRSQVTTVYVTSTQYSPHQTTVVVAGNNQNPTSTVVVGGGGVYVGGQSTKTVAYNGYCSTLYANGPNLPTTAQGSCGTILVLNEASVRSVGVKIWGALAVFYGLLGLCGLYGFRQW